MPRFGHIDLFTTQYLIPAQSHGRSVTALAGENINLFN